MAEGYARYEDESCGPTQFKDGLQRQLRRQTVVTNATPLSSSRDRVARVSRGNATSISSGCACDVIAQEGVQRNPKSLGGLTLRKAWSR